MPIGEGALRAGDLRPGDLHWRDVLLWQKFALTRAEISQRIYRIMRVPEHHMVFRSVWPFPDTLGKHSAQCLQALNEMSGNFFEFPARHFFQFCGIRVLWACR